MRYPKPLRENGTIGFVAPAFGCNVDPYKTAFDNALMKFKQMGYRCDLGPNCYEGRGIGISNTPTLCAAELMKYYESDKNDCLLSCGGGELMCEILDELDFERLAEVEPKWYMGYSDNTNFTFLMATLCDTATIYGPCAAAFGMEPWHESINDCMELITGKRKAVHSYDKWELESLKDMEHPLMPYHATEERVLKVFQNGELINATEVPIDLQVRGRLLGGCMDCLVHLCGTKYDKVNAFSEKYKEDGIIWFLEACDLNVFSIRRTMWQMEHNGWFQHVKAFLIGRPLLGESMMGLDKYQAVFNVAEKYQVPVLMDLDIGHIPPMMPLVVGSMADVTVHNNDVEIMFDYC